MKTTLTISLLVICLIASAQKKQHSNISQHVHDDGKTLSIAVNGNTNGRTVYYNHTFDVAGMDKAAKDSLVKRITDSLGVRGGTPPSPPAPPAPPAAPRGNGNNHYNSDIDDDGKTMSINISGSNQKKSFSYSRTFNVVGMSAGQKKAIIKHITDSLGVSKNLNLNIN